MRKRCGSFLQQFLKTKALSHASADDQARSMDSHEIQCEKGHTDDPVRKASWTEIPKRNLAFWVNKFSLAVQEQIVNQLLQQWVAGLWT